MIDFSLATCKNEVVEALCDLLKIESVKSEPQTNMPYGEGVFQALMHMMNVAEGMDFDSENLFSHLGYVEYGEGEEVFAILVHLDVMPAGDGWTVPPFDGTVKDGRVYGRGALDNKGPAIAALFALNAVNENCISLNKRVRLIFGCDEESGWSDIKFYKENGGIEPAMAISPDAFFPIINAEKGLLHLNLTRQAYVSQSSGGVGLVSINGGDRVNAVPAFCECLISGNTDAVDDLIELFNDGSTVKIESVKTANGMKLTSTGHAAHGSKPEDGRNAVAAMVSFLNQLPMNKGYLSDAVYQVAQYVGMETDGKSMGVASEDESGPLTLNLGYIKTTEDGVAVGIDIRHPVHTPQQQVIDTIKEKMTEFEVEIPFSLPPHYVPEDSTLVQGLKKAYEEITGEKAECLSMGGATYARAFENAVAFGPLFPGEPGTEHQADEYIEIDTLIKLGDIIANAIVILCTDQ